MTANLVVRSCSDRADVALTGSAIAVSFDSERDQWHAGVLYLDASDEVNFLHLAWHRELRSDTPSPNLCWIELALPRDRALSVAARCRQVWRRHGTSGLPYAFKYVQTVFTGTGDLALGAGEYGLTCATFVMAIFASVGSPLLIPTQWPLREQDRLWHAKIIDALTRRASREHLDAVRTEVGSARFQPTEVAACSSYPGLVDAPAPFAYAEVAAPLLEKRYLELSSLRAPPDVKGS
jgi:hypothetical protein